MLKLGVALLLISCGGKSDDPPKPVVTPAKPEAPKSDPPAVRPPTPTPPSKNLGECKFTVSGGATAEVTAPGGISAISLSHWTVDPKTRQMMYPNNTHGMILNCTTADASLSFTAAKLTAQELPFGPHNYALEKGMTTKVHVIGRIKEGSVVGAEGSLDVTALDAEHIAGTFAFKSQLMKRDKGGLAPLEIKGSFDYKCPGTCK